MGALKLDNYTLDKMVAVPGLALLVKIDKSYAYGDKEDAFKELCTLAYPVKNFLVAEVPVQEYGDKENDDIREKYGVKAEDLPAFFLFKGDIASPVKFAGFADPASQKPATWDDDEDGEWESPMISDMTAENLALWLRTLGVKMPSVGTIAELDEVAKKFMKDLSPALIEEAKKLADGEHANDKKAQIYVKAMEKVREKGVGYVEGELARIKRIMAGKITPEKMAEMTDKQRILNVFAEKDE